MSAIAEQAPVAVQEHHIGFAFKVIIRDVPDALVEAKVAEWGGPLEDSWLHHIQTIIRALRADPARLDAYVAHRCAWELLLEAGAEGDDLCGVLEVPRDSAGVVALVLGLHLPPATRRFVKSLREPYEEDGRTYDHCFEFAEALQEFIVVASDGVWHHREADGKK